MEPSYTLTERIVSLVGQIAEATGRFSASTDQSLRLRRTNRIRTIHGSVAIEGNTLSEEQITAILEGKRVIAPSREILEVQNALKAYDQMSKRDPLFVDIAVENMIYARQQDYYLAINRSNAENDCKYFIEYVLEVILQSLGTDQVDDQVSDQVKRLVKTLGLQRLSAVELMERLALSHRPTFRKNYLKPALESGLIAMSQPDSPRSPTQKYFLTGKGKGML